ncbi:MAG: WD40-repeat-containing domain protein [Benniella sp.]|nr:MAG: WD40-repeat-containing domain protein [Benniella sp.]
MLGMSSPAHGQLSPQIALKLSKAHLENARRTSDPELAAIFYNEARVALSRMDQPTLEALLGSGSDLDQYLHEETQYVTSDLNEMLNSLRVQSVQAMERMTESTDSTDGNLIHSDDSIFACSQDLQRAESEATMIPCYIFAENKRPPAAQFTLPAHGERLKDTPQLAYCLGLLQTWRSSPDSILDPAALNWLHSTDTNEDEVERLTILATDVILAFTLNGIYDAKFIAEVVCLAPVLEKAIYRHLLGQFCSAIERSSNLNCLQLEGLAQVIRCASPDYIDADDLVKVLRLFKDRLRDIPEKPSQSMHELILAVSGVLDAMADVSIKDLGQKKLYDFLSEYLDSLRATSDPSLVYQAAYAYQALQRIPDRETIWQSALSRNGIETSRHFRIMDTMNDLDLSEIFEQLQTIYSESTVHSGAKIRKKNEPSLQEHLQEGCSFECRQTWYPALRMADALLRCGRFTNFKIFICGVPCRQDPAFLWGLCQCLKDLASNLEWDTGTRLNAIALLEEIYRRDDIWGDWVYIKERIVETLTQMASLPETFKQAAATVLQQLRADGDSVEQLMDRVYREQGPGNCPFNAAFPLLATPSLLDHVQDILGVEGRLSQLRKQRLKERNVMFVEIRAKDSLQTLGHDHFSLMDKAKEFLSSDGKAFLVLGTPGAGKSTFSRELECDLWHSYKRLDGDIPLYINMAAVDGPNEDPITKVLQKTGFSKDQMSEMRRNRKFVLICDEHDQIQPNSSLYTGNMMNQAQDWDAKILVCSRLGDDHSDHFQPTEQNRQPQPELIQQAVITPFSADQVRNYIDRYVSIHHPPWKMDEFQRALDRNPGLKDLAKNPLLLSLALEVMPGMVGSGQQLSTKKFTRVEVYDQIIEQWFKSSKERLEKEDLSLQSKDALERLTSDGFVSNGINYLKRLAAAIYKNQDDVSTVEYSQLQDRGAWKEQFFRQDERNQLLRKASPMKCSGSKCRFIHPSLLEYGLALAVFDPQEVNKIAVPNSESRRNSVDSAMSFELNDHDEGTATVVEHSSDLRSPLSWRNIVSDSSILYFLEERVHQEPLFKQQLMAFVELSKTDKKWRMAATNAMTILVGAGIQFNGADLRGIQIPGADLSHGVFDSAQLQGADLRKTILRNIWLYKADLSRAQMRGAHFGELPYLTENSVVESCAYSSDGKYFANVLDNTINVYTTTNWERIRTFSGRFHRYSNVAFSLGGTTIASGDGDSIRLWNVQTGTCLKTITYQSDYHNSISNVAFSSRGDHIASCGSDRTVRLWNVESGECRHILSGHERLVLCVVFSPTGSQLVSAGEDNTARLWDVEAGVLHHTFIGHSSVVEAVAFSPHGHLVGSASCDETVRLWDVATGACRHVLHHLGWAMSVAFSPLGDVIASGGIDESVRLWDVETGVCQYVLCGYNAAIRAIAFSPNGGQIACCCGSRVLLRDSRSIRRHIQVHHVEQIQSVAISPKDDCIASGGFDRVVRLWDFDTGICLNALRGHEGTIMSIAFSPSGDQVASGSMDKIVRLWDTTTGFCKHILSGHNGGIRGITFSPDGDWIASGSNDQTVRLWNVETGACDKVLEGHGDKVISVAFSPSGGLVTCVSASVQMSIHSWDAGLKVYKRELHGHTNWIENVVFSPKRDQIASSSHDATVRLWNVEDGACCHVLNGHKALVMSTAFSPRGDLIASGSEDGTVRLWEVASGQCRAEIERFRTPVDSLAWTTRSGVEYLVASEGDGTVQLLQVNEVEGRFSVRLCWNSCPPQLNVAGASIQDVRGLSDVNTVIPP